jgi:hypothetical protein
VLEFPALEAQAHPSGFCESDYPQHFLVPTWDLHSDLEAGCRRTWHKPKSLC